jgi:hypothetical protein
VTGHAAGCTQVGDTAELEGCDEAVMLWLFRVISTRGRPGKMVGEGCLSLRHRDVLGHPNPTRRYTPPALYTNERGTGVTGCGEE